MLVCSWPPAIASSRCSSRLPGTSYQPHTPQAYLGGVGIAQAPQGICTGAVNVNGALQPADGLQTTHNQSCSGQREKSQPAQHAACRCMKLTPVYACCSACGVRLCELDIWSAQASWLQPGMLHSAVQLHEAKWHLTAATITTAMSLTSLIISEASPPCLK